MGDPERAALRSAARVLVRVASRPPPHMCRTPQGLKEWDEVEVRLRGIVALVKGWEAVGNGHAQRPEERLAGEDEEEEAEDARERRVFVAALRDGYVLCQ